MHKFTFLDNTANFVLNSSLVEHIIRHHGYQTPYLNDCFYLKKWQITKPVQLFPTSMSS